MGDDNNCNIKDNKLVMIALLGVVVTLFISMTALMNTHDINNKIVILNEKIDRINSYEQEMRYEVTTLQEDVDDLNQQVETLRENSAPLLGELNLNLEDLDLNSILDGMFSGGNVGNLDDLFGGEFNSNLEDKSE